MRVIIAGGRDFDDYDLLSQKCDRILKFVEDVEVVSGTARGADRLGERYAKERGFKVTQFTADWWYYGKSAGYVRNKEMAKYADALIAFHDGSSRGTQHMINLAKSYGLKIRIVKYVIDKKQQ